MTSDLYVLETLRAGGTPTVPDTVFRQGVASCLLSNLTTEAENFITVMEVGLNSIEKHNHDFESQFKATMNYARLQDSPQSRELADRAMEVQDRLAVERERYVETIRNKYSAPRIEIVEAFGVK